MFSQLDTEHWFAPMFDRTSNANQIQRIYMSTNETTPFKVEIYNNNVVIGTVTISKNNPQFFNVTRSMIISRLQSDLFKPVNKGIYLKGERSFYASLRFSVAQHAEILTSKGTAGLGTDFRVAMAPIAVYNGILNFMTSVIATENNTTVTVSGFDPNVKFSDGITRTQISFVLNKGQSYMIDGIGDEDGNEKGIIGAKISADKPISITNGNFNGQYAGSYPNASDILMDQGVPEDRLGKTFILVKGNGANSFLDDFGTTTTMEKAIIVAVKDNTEIYLNDNTTPSKILQTGEFFETPPDSYKDQGSGHYNLYISSNNDIYVYQLLAGIENGNPPSNSNGEATGGFNYIPPLSCYLPKKIDEIGLIDQNRVFISSINSYRDQIPTKFNIITERGASIDVKSNGVSLVLSASNGPFDVTGNNSWVTYSIPNITGNVAVISNKAVTAGISAGDDAVGYGGYFAGFSFIPAIIRKEGECVPDVTLELAEGFDFYQWMKKNQTTGLYEDIAGATTNLYKPTEAGYYKARVKQGSCAEVITAEFKFLSCLSYTLQSYQTCKDLLLTPKLTLGNQGVVGTSIAIVKQPVKGTVTIDPVAKTISYTANPNTSGLDSFRYKFIGDDPVTPESEEVLVNINIKNIIASDIVFKGCKINNTTGEFNLTKANVTTDATVTSKIFYKTQFDADNDTGLNTIPTASLTNYQSPEGFIYVRLNNGFCPKTVKIELKYAPIPELISNTYEGCDLDFKGVKVNLNQIKAQILKDAAYFPDANVSFYLNGVKLNNNWTYSSDTVVQMEVKSPDGCSTVTFTVNFKVGARISLINSTNNYTLCDPNFDDSENVDLNNYKNLFLSAANLADTNIKTYFYLSLIDAQENKNALPAGNVVLTKDVNYYYRFEKAGICPNVAELKITYTKGFASTTLPAIKTICENTTTQLDAGTAHKSYKWYKESDPATVIGTLEKITLGPGKYYVILTSVKGCDYKQNFEIIASPKALLDTSKFNATFCDDDFDGLIKVKFSTAVTPTILLNNSSLYTVTYYSGNTMSSAQLLPDNWTYSTDTTVYVKVTSPYCVDVNGTINFKIGKKVPLLGDVQTAEVCDDDLDGKKLVQNLDSFVSLFTNDSTASGKFYLKKSDAQTNAANNITEIDVTNQQTLYVRLSNATDCSALGELTVKIKLPVKSTVLADQTICPESTTDVDAGSGFIKYEWFKESDPATPIGNSQVINIGLGKYFVILTAQNGCPYKQNFEIKAAELPIIESVEINGSTVKINAKGGKMPYRYAIDNGNYQDSNIFTNVSSGFHKAYVISADNCDPIEKEFSVIEIYNLISPNGDGVNDVLDMSLLKSKVNPKLYIYDRVGRKLFEGGTQNNFIWDGKKDGKVLSTSSYWYIMEWQDFDNSAVMKYTGWILLKNRNLD